MIPKSYIQEWSRFVPWQEPRQIEQDLIITGALIKLYQHPNLKTVLAFRGGTALNKFFFKPASRYSEDIDLVQVNSEPIGNTIGYIREALDSWLGEPKRNLSEGRVTLIYRTVSEDGFPLRLKVEINSREHFTVLGFVEYDFEITSSWMKEKVSITTYKIEELLGTKLRALYQRRKGRDLYDLYIALRTIEFLDTQAIINCFQAYMEFGGHKVSKLQFLANMEQKLQNPEFLGDMVPLLPVKGPIFDPVNAYLYVKEMLLEKI